MTDTTTVTEGGSLLARACEELWQAVRERDEYAAGQAVFSALAAGASAEDVLLEVIAPVQRRVGGEWAAGRFTVAQEHAATAIHDRIIAAMAHRAETLGASGASGASASAVPSAAGSAPVAAAGVEPVAAAGSVTVACVDGEWHSLPARLLAEVLRHRGHRVDFLGAKVPTPHLIAHLHQTAPDAVALSSSIPVRLPGAHAAITAVQAIGIPVLVGGAAFGPDGRYARLLGADAWAPDARAAAGLLAQGLPRPATGAVRQTVEDLPHLSDQEYTLVLRNKRQLVKNTLTGLEERLPAVRAYTDAQRDRTAEDVVHILDFLTTALYMDDAELFTGFLDWTGDVLEARHVPAGVLDPGLAILQEELKDFPRALRILTRGRAALRGRDARPPFPGPRHDA
ncbi:B12-binding domain-containing protein [Streptomyces sp. NPDC015131]|uniref:cobalamin B12-binding domain-containing protein n=1 Tax=Streptomyces sp. NPDC015131 TaxID=3364941 RepID=UPI003701E930